MYPINNNLRNQQYPIQPIQPQNFYNYRAIPNAVPNVLINNDNINENINNIQNQIGNPMMGNLMMGNLMMGNPMMNPQQMFMNPMQQQMFMQQQHQNFMIQQQMMHQQQQFMIQQQDLKNLSFKQPIKKNESDESSEEELIKQKPIKRTKLITKEKGKSKGISFDDVMDISTEEQEQILENPRKQLVPTAKLKTNEKSIEDDMDIFLDKKDEIAKKKEAPTVDVFLANIFDKSLDTIKFKEPKDKSFMSKKNNSNVIKSISPKNLDKAHFNKDTHPDEVYNVKFLGTFEEIFETKALDINDYSLETHKYIYEYNKTFAGKAHNTNKAVGFIYARSSSDNTVSIETQRQVCFKFASDNNIKLCDFGFQFDNNISARNMNNIKHELGFWKEYIEDGSHVIIYSVDRLSRHLINGMKYLDEMVFRGITFHFVTNELKYGPESTATQKGMVQTLLIEAEKFSNMTSEKIKTTRKRLLAEGNELGPAKYGFKVVLVNGIRKKLICSEEMATIRNIKIKYKDIRDNFKNYKKTENIQKSFISISRFISRWCVLSGIKYRKGQPFTEMKIREIVKSK